MIRFNPCLKFKIVVVYLEDSHLNFSVFQCVQQVSFAFPIPMWLALMVIDELVFLPLNLWISVGYQFRESLILQKLYTPTARYFVA